MPSSGLNTTFSKLVNINPCDQMCLLYCYIIHISGLLNHYAPFAETSLVILEYSLMNKKLAWVFPFIIFGGVDNRDLKYGIPCNFHFCQCWIFTFYHNPMQWSTVSISQYLIPSSPLLERRAFSTLTVCRYNIRLRPSW